MFSSHDYKVKWNFTLQSTPQENAIKMQRNL